MSKSLTAWLLCVSRFPGYLPFGAAANNVAEVVQDTLDGNPSFDEVQWSAVSEVCLSRLALLVMPIRVLIRSVGCARSPPRHTTPFEVFSRGWD